MNKRLTLLASAILSLGMAATAPAETLKMAYDADPVTMDPQEQLSGGMLQLSHMTFDPLVRWGKDLSFEPRLAEKWERIDENTMRFFLRKGVKFHSGNEMTAKDVLFTFNRLKTSPDFKGIFASFTEAKAVDDYTVDLVTDKPFPLVLHNATYIFPMDSAFYSGEDENGKAKDAIVKAGDSFASRNMSGTGPFTITSREQGVKVEFERNADYWDKESKGNVSKIVLTPIKEDPTRVAALLSGDVDFIAPVPPNDHERVSGSDKVDLITMGGTRIITFQLNQERVEAFKNPKVRLAINYAINQEGIVKKIMKGFATAGAQNSPKGYLGHNEALTPRYDVAKAKELMKEAGYEDGFSVTMWAPNNRYVNDEKICQAVVGLLARVGIKVDLNAQPKSKYFAKVSPQNGNDTSFYLLGWTPSSMDVHNVLYNLMSSFDTEKNTGQFNYGRYSNTRIDEIASNVEKETDQAKRQKMVAEAFSILKEDVGYLPLHQQPLSWGVRDGVTLSQRADNVLDIRYVVIGK